MKAIELKKMSKFPLQYKAHCQTVDEVQITSADDEKKACLSNIV